MEGLKDKDQRLWVMRLIVSSGIRMELTGCDSFKQIWDKLAKLHRMIDKNY
jgi:hypothetical protein